MRGEIMRSFKFNLKKKLVLKNRSLFFLNTNVQKSILIMVFSTLFLAGCSNSSSKSSANLKKYAELKKSLGPVHNSPPPKEQYFISSDIYKLYVLGESGQPGSNNIDFVAGQRNKIVIHSELTLSGVTYKLTSPDLPPGSESLKNIGNGNWEFSWTPSLELIRAFKNQEPKRFHISIEILEVTDVRSKAIAEQIASSELTILYKVISPNDAPEIVEIQNLESIDNLNTINEGDVKDFTVIVQDRSSTKTQPPSLEIKNFPDRIARESVDIDAGRRFIILGPAEAVTNPQNGKIIDGMWKFQVKMNTSVFQVPVFQIPNKETNPASINGHVMLYARSETNGTMSAIKKISFEIIYRVELLRPVFENFNPEIATINQTESFKFKFNSLLTSNVGNLIVALSDETIKLAGTPKISCENAGRKPIKLSCSLTWKVPCDVAPGEYNLKIQSIGEYLDKNTSAEIEKKVIITENKKCAPNKPSTSEGNQ